jgi:site-specific DNA recombinase
VVQLARLSSTRHRSAVTVIGVAGEHEMQPTFVNGKLAVDYGRYSNEIQSDASIEDQARICQERIRREGWTYLRSYQDRAMSGASRLRPAYQQLLEDARRGQFNIVVAESLDRLSRDQEDVALLFKHLTYAGVRLFTLSEGWITELHIGLTGTMGALFLKQLAEKTHRGLRGRVEAGRSGGGNSYGYTVVVAPGADGEIEHGLRKRKEAEVPHILRIMTDYANGLSPRSIAKALNAAGIPGPSGDTWGPSTINGNATRGTGILNNELYVGKLIWNRLRYLKNPTTGKRQSRLNPVEAWIVKDVPELRIVPQELWDKVKARQLQMSKETRPGPAKSHEQFWEHQRPRYLLSGLMKCGCCGANYTKYGANRFACAGARDRATCTNGLTIRGADVEASILAGLKTRIMDPALFELFAKEFIIEANAQRMNTNAAKANAKGAVERVERQIKRLVDAIVAGADALPLNAKLKELDAEKNRLVAELDTVTDDQPLLHPNLAAIYRSRVEALEIALRDPQDGREAFEMVRSLVEEVRLVPVDGQLIIELKGQLASILAIADRTKQSPEKSKQTALQIKMVAGACNQ